MRKLRLSDIRIGPWVVVPIAAFMVTLLYLLWPAFIERAKEACQQDLKAGHVTSCPNY